MLLAGYLSLFCISISIAQQKQLSDALKKEVEGNLAKAKVMESEGDFNQAGYFYNNVATTYWVNGLSEDAISNFQKVISMYEKTGNINAIKNTYNNLGMIYTDAEDYPNALLYFEKCLTESRKMGRKPDIVSVLINIANTHSEIGNYDKAVKTLEEASSTASELNDAKLLRNIYSLLAEVYDKQGNSQKSAEYFSMYTAITKKVQREEMQKKEAEANKIVDEAQNKVKEVESQKQMTEEKLQSKKDELQATEKNLEKVEQVSSEQKSQIDLLSREKELQNVIIGKQKMVRNIFIVLIFFVLGFSGMIFYSLSQKKKANALLADQNKEILEQRDLIEEKGMELIKAMVQIEKQNKDITSSITYAQRIQESLLPAEKSLQGAIPDSFILLRPRDIVSGDFYWFTGYSGKNGIAGIAHRHFIRLSNIPQDETGFMIAAVDCTGHGVPGAFMSMIGFNILETIARSGVVKPNEILHDLHRAIRYLLKQSSSDNRDGMDMAICAIKENGHKLEYAGAINPLYYIANGELVHIKGDPIPIGGIQKEKRREYTIHTIDITSPTCFYIFSDGFADQFGGEFGDKFSTKRFKELLVEIHQLPMSQQREILNQKLTDWIGENNKQIDDVLVIGFKLGEKTIEFT